MTVHREPVKLQVDEEIISAIGGMRAKMQAAIEVFDRRSPAQSDPLARVEPGTEAPAVWEGDQA